MANSNHTVVGQIMFQQVTASHEEWKLPSQLQHYN